MVWVEALIPFDKGELLSTIHKVGMVEKTVRFVFPIAILPAFLDILNLFSS